MPNTLEQHAVRPNGRLDVHVEDALNDYDEPLRWMASWLLADAEGEIIGMGRGGGAASGDIPSAAVGYRVRRWHFDGVAPEYEDHLFPHNA